jgi:coenzyme F420-reducing hydrogenase delta subunit
MHLRKKLSLAMGCTLCVAGAAMAAETIVYRYDARGRLVKVERSGNVNNGVTANYAFDKANNRTNKTVSGAP